MANGVIIERTDAKDVREKNIRVLDIFLRLLRKTFRVACDTLNEMFCLRGGQQKGNARGLILFVHGTDRPGLEFLLRFESTIYEEREAFEY